ncbi:MAG: hypothetical protein WC028_22875 [Candidatus Obscuribacterales bacterium]
MISFTTAIRSIAPHKLQVFFSGSDMKLYPTVAAVFKQLELLAALDLPCPGYNGLMLEVHDTDEASFELTETLVQTIASSRDTVVMLLAPQLLLAKGMLNSPAQRALSANFTNKTNISLSVYCEQLVREEAVSKQFGSFRWVVGAERRIWLSKETDANDAAASAVNRLFDAIEKILGARQNT